MLFASTARLEVAVADLLTCFTYHRLSFVASVNEGTAVHISGPFVILVVYHLAGGGFRPL